MDSEIIPATQIAQLPLTQKDKKSKIKYSWIILFKFDVNETQPFSVAKLKDFADCDFPWNTITQELTHLARIQIHEFSCLPGHQYAIFAKIQYGKYIL